MNKEDLQEVTSQLEALDSLAKLFKNMWFKKVRQEVEDEKVKAYLLVFEDAFPAMNHVIEYVRRSSDFLIDGQLGGIQKEFETLSRNLLDREVDVKEERGAVEVSADNRGNEGSIDSLFEIQEAAEPGGTTGGEELEALLSTDGEEETDFEEDEAEDDIGVLSEDEEVEEAEDDIGALLDDDEEVEEEDISALLEGDDEDEVGDDGDEEEFEDLLGATEEEDEDDEIDFDDLLEDEADTSSSEDDDIEVGDDDISEEDIEDLFEAEDDDSSEDEELDLGNLMDEDEEEESGVGGVGISDDEMAALLDEEEKPAPKKTTKRSPAKKATKSKIEEVPDTGNGDESISQDEIDALFG